MRILIGLLLIIFLSPLTVWYAESQHRARDFGKAEITDASVSRDGYIVIEGKATSPAPVTCPPGAVSSGVTDCVYVRTQIEEFVLEERTQCGEISDDVRIIEQVDDRCDSNGTNCEKCYRVEEEKWETKSTESEYASFALGVYTVKPSGSANFVGESKEEVYIPVVKSADDDETDDVDLSDEEDFDDEYIDDEDEYEGELFDDEDFEDEDAYEGELFDDEDFDDEYVDNEDEDEYVDDGILDSADASDEAETGDATVDAARKANPEIGDRKYTYTYLSTSQNLLAAGDASGNRIESAKDRVFVVSSLSYAGTLDALEKQDTTTMWMLRVVSLLLMIFGFILIASPFAEIFGVFFKFIPFVGGAVNRGIGAAVSAVAGIIGLAVWLVVWIVVLVVKNIIAIFIVLTVIGALVGLYLLKFKKTHPIKLPNLKKPSEPEKK